MFRIQSFLNRAPRRMSQSLLGHCHELLNPTSISQPELCHTSNPAQKLRIPAAAGGDVSLSTPHENLRNLRQQSQAINWRPNHSMAVEMESSKAAAALAKQLWEMSQREAYCALYHPFVVAMAAGTLPVESFRDYIAQDVFYLAAFAEAYGLAMKNTDDEEAKEVLRGLQHHVQEELDQVHMLALQSFGLQLPSRIVPNAATTAYTKFLLAVAEGDLRSQWVLHSGDDSDESEAELRGGGKLAAFTVGALTPCMRLYAFLGQEIKRAFPNGLLLQSNPYAKWVETYASADFEAASSKSEELLQNLVSPFSGEREFRENVRNLYGRAMELEVEFFAAQSLSNKSIVPLLKSSGAAHTRFILVSDFDLTCTLEDSCSVLAELVMAGADGAKAHQLEAKWVELGTQYSVEQKELLNRLLPPPSQQQQSEEYNPHGLREVMEKLADFERKANSRIVQSGFLAGLGMEAVKQAGSRVGFPEGCQHLLTRVSEVEQQQSMEFHILSVCWSRSLIQSSFSSKGLQFANIHSNELQFNSKHVSEGDIDRRIEAAVDKEEVFNRIVSQARQNSHQNQHPLSIYIGDSVTDLLCLLRADIGVVIGESSSLERMAQAFGIGILPLYTGLLQREQQQQSGDPGAEDVGRSLWTKFEGVLYRVSSWNELNAFLLGS